MTRALLLLVLAPAALAWDTPPHRSMTQAALNALPQRFRDRLGPEVSSLEQFYCMLPDRYLELRQFGFRRKSPGPQTLEEMQPYCLRPDGELIHSATFDRDEDLASVVYLMERTVRSLAGRRPEEAARYMGTLAHFIEDSLSPPHAVSSDELEAMVAAPSGHGRLNIHSVLERSLPEFALTLRVPPAPRKGIVAAAEAVLTGCYEAAERNRRVLPDMVKAAYDADEAVLNTHRLNAGRTAAGLLADALAVIFGISDSR